MKLLRFVERTHYQCDAWEEKYLHVLETWRRGSVLLHDLSGCGYTISRPSFHFHCDIIQVKVSVCMCVCVCVCVCVCSY